MQRLINLFEVSLSRHSDLISLQHELKAWAMFLQPKMRIHYFNGCWSGAYKLSTKNFLMVFRITPLGISLFFYFSFLVLIFFYGKYIVKEEEILSKLIARIDSLETELSQESVFLQVIVKEIDNSPSVDILLIRLIFLSLACFYFFTSFYFFFKYNKKEDKK